MTGSSDDGVHLSHRFLEGDGTAGCEVDFPLGNPGIECSGIRHQCFCQARKQGLGRCRADSREIGETPCLVVRQVDVKLGGQGGASCDAVGLKSTARSDGLQPLIISRWRELASALLLGFPLSASGSAQLCEAPDHKDPILRAHEKQGLVRPGRPIRQP